MDTMEQVLFKQLATNFEGLWGKKKKNHQIIIDLLLEGNVESYFQKSKPIAVACDKVPRNKCIVYDIIDVRKDLKKEMSELHAASASDINKIKEKELRRP